MNRSELIEIRKLFNYDEKGMSAGQLCGCFINAKKEIKGAFSEKLISKKKEEVHKYLDIFKKVLPNDACDVNVKGAETDQDEPRFLLEKLRGTSLKESVLLDAFYKKVAEVLPDNNYVALVSDFSYDVPVKTKDKLKIDDASAEVFHFIICAVCKVKTEKGTLGYQPDSQTIGENPQQMVIEKPSFGFMWPSFSDRSTDKEHASCFRTESLDLTDKLIGTGAPALEPKKTKAKTPKESPDAKPPGYVHHDVTEVRNASEKDPYASSTAHIPSLDTGTLSNKAEYVQEKTIDTSSDDDTPKSAGPSDADIIASSKSMAPAPKPKKKPVLITGDKKKMRKAVIDGVQCWVIPVDEVEIE